MKLGLNRKGKLAVLAAAGIGVAYYLWNKRNSVGKETTAEMEPHYVTVRPTAEAPAGVSAEDSVEAPVEEPARGI